MKPRNLDALLLAITLMFGMGQIRSLAQTKERGALKFDELPMGFGAPQSPWAGTAREQEKEMRSRLQRYARCFMEGGLVYGTRLWHAQHE